MKYRIIKVKSYTGNYLFVIQKQFLRYWWKDVKFYIYLGNNDSDRFRYESIGFMRMFDAEQVIDEVVLKDKVVEVYKNIPIVRLLNFGVQCLRSIEYAAPSLRGTYKTDSWKESQSYFVTGNDLTSIKYEIDKELQQRKPELKYIVEKLFNSTEKK